jgi:hypothetical protein
MVVDDKFLPPLLSASVASFRRNNKDFFDVTINVREQRRF